MDEKKQRDIASRGGQASGGNFKNDPERASAAGRKGGRSVPPAERSFSRDRGLAAEAGRRGGEHSHGGSGAGPLRSGEPIGARHGGTGAGSLRDGEPIGARHDSHPKRGGVGGDVPEHSKEKDTELAIHAGGRGGEDGDSDC
jgi:hypothetical protein